MRGRNLGRGWRSGLLDRRWVAAVLTACLLTTAVHSLTSAEEVRLSSSTSNAIVRDGTISSPSDIDWFSLFALAGRSYSISLERHTLPAGRVSVWMPPTDESAARKVAVSPDVGGPLIWSAPESGAWRVGVEGVGALTGSYRLRIQDHVDAIGASLPTARAAEFDVDGVLIERSSIDNPGDVDWIAFPVAAGNRYAIWSVLGSVGGLSGSLRPPGQSSFTDLPAAPGAISSQLEPDRDGMAVLAVRASLPWQVGSYAVGVTRFGSHPEPQISLPPLPTPALRVESIDASASVGEAQFAFRGQWGPIRQTSGLRVWIDTDPGADGEDGWEYLLRSNDGRTARLWSFEQQAWIATNVVGARGFDTLVMRWSGRTADERIRWQASVKNSDGAWTLSRPRLLDVPHPPPALPPAWFARTRTGSEDPRWDRDLAAAGVVADLPEDALVVVIDPGHGLYPGAAANGVQEAASNLDFALRIEEILEAQGVTVVLARRDAGAAYLNLDHAFLRADLQARAELAHVAKADLFVSIHSNANYRSSARGLEAWYWPSWNGSGVNLRLSELLLEHVRRALGDFGYPTTAIAYDSTCWEIISGLCDPLYVLAPFLLMDADAARRWGFNPAELGLSEDRWGEAINNWLWLGDITRGEPPIDLIDPATQSGPGRIVRGNLMPTTLLELLYVTDEGDARILRDPEAREVIARAIADGILDFLGVR